MKKNKIIKNVSFILVNIILLIVISIVYKDMLKAATMYRMDKLNLDIIIIGLILLIFGLLIEYDRLLQAIKIGFNINILKLMLAIIILIISLLPYGFIIPINIRIGEILNYKIVRYLFSIWSGILISRSLMIKKMPIDIKKV